MPRRPGWPGVAEAGSATRRSSIRCDPRPMPSSPPTPRATRSATCSWRAGAACGRRGRSSRAAAWRCGSGRAPLATSTRARCRASCCWLRSCPHEAAPEPMEGDPLARAADPTPREAPTHPDPPQAPPSEGLAAALTGRVAALERELRRAFDDAQREADAMFAQYQLSQLLASGGRRAELAMIVLAEIVRLCGA